MTQVTQLFVAAVSAAAVAAQCCRAFRCLSMH